MRHPHMRAIHPSTNSITVILQHLMPPDKSPKSRRLSALLACIQQGDRFAESEFCELLHPGLRIIAERRANTQDSEDIAQEAMLAVLEAARAGRITSADAVAAFARAVVHNMCCNKVKLLSRARLQGNSDDLAVLPSPHSTPEESAGERQSLSIARKVLSELSSQHREILRRFYLEEQTQEQICQDLGLTTTQFRLAKSRAMTRFGEIGRLHLMRKARGTDSRPVTIGSARCA
jgi:RNA polymerase sigma factor (sigma-70 family)